MDVDGTDQLLSDQHHELTATAGVNSDIDIAFQLQLQEAIRASFTTKSSSSSSPNEVFRVYSKGLVSDKTVSNIKMSFAGIGVAICDTNDCLIFKSRKSFLLDAGCRGNEGDLVELQALIEALNVAANFGLKQVHVFCDSNSVYQYLTGKQLQTNKKIVTLVDQLNLIQSKFIHCGPFYVKQNDIKFVYKLAGDAIASEVTKWVTERDSGVTITEQCKICFEFIQNRQMFAVNRCMHRYCFSCIRKHIEAKLLLGKLPDCPHEKCESNIGIESCRKFLSPELYDIMNLRVKEASIPPTDKVYCPFSNCSALMSKTEVEEYTIASCSAARGSGMRKCVTCNLLFCIDCKVPWHDNLSCLDYMNSSSFRSSNEAKLKFLATEKHWRECIKCKSLVELATGCYHISCRCGHEFCYTCGAEWINKGPTCKCPIWDERNIIYDL